MRTVIFDLDGTLADTSKDLIAAANACFQGLGAGDVLDPIADAATALRGGRAMLTLGYEKLGQPLDEAEITRQYPVLLEYYGDNIDTHTTMYEGSVEAINELKAKGYAVGICTNKPEGLAETLMQRLGVRDMFGSLIGADTLPTRKPDAAPYIAAVEQAGGQVATSLLVGDTKTDRDTATAAGVPSLLVTFGPAGGDMAALKPEALLPHYDDLGAIVKRLIG